MKLDFETDKKDKGYFYFDYAIKINGGCPNRYLVEKSIFLQPFLYRNFPTYNMFVNMCDWLKIQKIIKETHPDYCESNKYFKENFLLNITELSFKQTYVRYDSVVRKDIISNDPPYVVRYMYDNSVKYVVVNGNHRIFNKLYNNITKINCLVFTVDNTIKNDNTTPAVCQSLSKR